jgi:hypothetical protein
LTVRAKCLKNSRFATPRLVARGAKGAELDADLHSQGLEP